LHALAACPPLPLDHSVPHFPETLSGITHIVSPSHAPLTLRVLRIHPAPHSAELVAGFCRLTGAFSATVSGSVTSGSCSDAEGAWLRPGIRPMGSGRLDPQRALIPRVLLLHLLGRLVVGSGLFCASADLRFGLLGSLEGVRTCIPIRLAY